MNSNRRAVPMNSLQLSTGALSQTVGHGSGIYTPSQRISTPARSTAVQQHTFNATTSPTRRLNRNSSEGVAAVLGGTTLVRPSTRSRSEGPAAASSPSTQGASNLWRQGSSQGLRSLASLAPPSAAASEPLQFATPSFSNVNLNSVGKSANRPVVLAHGSGCTQGPRPTMEDAHFAIENSKDSDGNPMSLYGILDGHCGRRVADLGAQFFPDFFFSHPEAGKNTALALVESGIRTDHRVFQQIQRADGGSTVIIAAVKAKSIHVACIGDARAVLCDGGKAIPLSIDHKPTDPAEQQRVMRCGGMVHFGRVGGCLAVSRALGDFEFKFNGPKYVHKEYQVSNVADVMNINITDTTQFLILACDGLWDVMSNEEAAGWANEYISRQVEMSKSPTIDRQRILNNCSQRLAETAVERGSMDNVSVTIVAFHEWNKHQ